MSWNQIQTILFSLIDNLTSGLKFEMIKLKMYSESSEKNPLLSQLKSFVYVEAYTDQFGTSFNG